MPSASKQDGEGEGDMPEDEANQLRSKSKIVLSCVGKFM